MINEMLELLRSLIQPGPTGTAAENTSPSTTELRFKIGIVGPTRVGKTSLITAVLEQGKHALAGTPASLKPRGQTRGRIEEHKEALYSAILAGKFNAGALKGNVDSFIFELDMTVGNQSLRLDLLDYPGGWLSEATRPSSQEEGWTECLKFIQQSTVLLVPVDASAIMEAATERERLAIPRILRIAAVEEVVRAWAKSRAQAWREQKEPALLVVAPVKCESYLADNGGRREEGEQLRQKISQIYQSVLHVIATEAPEASVLYAPVDTYGCVELKEATFLLDEKPVPGFSAQYRFRELNPVIRPKGADVILGTICGQIVEAAANEARAEAERLEASAETARARTRPPGFFTGIGWFFTGEWGRRQLAAQVAGRRSHEQRIVVTQISDAVEILARHQPTGRSRWLNSKGGAR